MGKVGTRVHLSLYDDETSALCHWQIPEAHFLEAWSDGRAYDGTVSIVQPLIAPLYGGKSAHELLAAMSDRPERSGYDIVREHWQRERAGGQTAGTGASRTAPPRPEFDQDWRRWLHDGVVPDTKLAAKTVTVRTDAIARFEPGANRGTAERRRSVLPKRPLDARRPVRQQRLASGAAQADQQADVGQRRVREPGDGRTAQDRQHALVAGR